MVINIGSEPQTSGIAVADLDGDQKSQVVTVRGNSQAVTQETGSSGGAAGVPCWRVFPSCVFLVDIDGDGKRDIAPGGRNNGISVACSTTRGQHQARRSPTSFNVALGLLRRVSVGDVDGDGRCRYCRVGRPNRSTNYALRNMSVAGTVSFAASVAITGGSDGENETP